MKSYQITATDEVEVLIAVDDLNRTVYINIVGNEDIAVGASNVTFATGLLLKKHTTPQTIFVPAHQGLYCICDTGKTDDVRVLLPDSD
jgi:hypothetical protein